jgi:hypothetical protein
MERVRLGGERGLLSALREAEARLTAYMVEDVETVRAMHEMQRRHGAALEDAEIAGYERGLRDGRAEASNAENENARLRACLERWRHDGRLQSYEDRERFRAEAGALLLPNASNQPAP